MSLRLILGMLVLTAITSAQPRVDPRNLYHRIITVVPYVGSGTTAADPKRPQYAPVAATAVGTQPSPAASTPAGTTAVPPSPPAIIGFTHVPSDDGKYAVVEYVARDWAALQPIMSDPSLTVFVKGRDSKATIEAAIQKYKKNFSLDTFGAVIQ